MFCICKQGDGFMYMVRILRAVFCKFEYDMFFPHESCHHAGNERFTINDQGIDVMKHTIVSTNTLEENPAVI